MDVVARAARYIERQSTRWPGIQFVVLFGSVAKGAPRPNSDVDIGILGGGFWDQLDLGSELGRELGREPHVVDLASATDWLRFEVARSGRLLYQAEPGVWPRFQASAALQYFDLAPIIARCSEGVRRRLVREAGGTAP